MSELLDIMDRYHLENPQFGQFLSIMKTYGKVKNLSQEHIDKRIEQVNKDLVFVNNYLGMLDEDNKIEEIEGKVVKMRLQEELFEYQDLKSYQQDPMTYTYPLMSIQSIYTARDYANLDKRIKHIIETSEAVSRNLQIADQNLDDELSKTRIQVCLMITSSIVGYLQDKLIEFVVQSENSNLIDRWSDTNQKLITQLNSFLELLKTKYLPNGKDEFAYGEELFFKLLKNNELIEISVDNLLEIAENDLKRNYDQLQQILDKKGEEYLDEFFNDYPEPENLYEEAKKATKRAKKFVLDNEIATLKEPKEIEVVETPQGFRDFAFAAMNASGIGEDTPSDESYYYITTPDINWDDERKQNYMKRSFARGALEAVTIHEVWPGHYMHLQFVKQIESKIIRQLGFSTTTIEGWAHYCEELAIELGYDLYDPVKVHVGQLQWALVRNCRFVSSIKMHTQGMTVEESKKLFMEKAMMDQEGALKEARRGTFDPMYLNYTLGKLMIMKLREDYKKEKGKDFSLTQFHDDFLSYGGLPVVFMRELLLKDPGDRSEIL